MPANIISANNKTQPAIFYVEVGSALKACLDNLYWQITSNEGPSASAYVTYLRPEDALHAILLVNNLQIENRTLKASLGTTKYCSHFLKGTQCAKSDCMYLHDLGDDAASFSKEDIQQGKHLQYEQKLIEQYSQTSSETSKLSNGKSKSPSPSASEQQSLSSSLLQLSTSPDQSSISMKSNPNNADTLFASANFGSSNRQLDKIECEKLLHEKIDCDDTFNNNSNEPMRGEELSPEKGLYTENDDMTGEDLNDSDALDDDFGFDPWDISSKGLADMMEKERMVLQKLNLSTQMSANLKSPVHNHNHHNSQAYNPFHSQQTTLQQAANLPSWNHSPKPFSSFIEYNARQNSKLLQMMSSRTSNAGEQLFSNNPRAGDGYNAQGWQDDLKALLPNINISFSPPSGPNSNQQIRRTPQHPLINSSPLHHMQNGFHSFNNPMVYQETGSSDWYSNGGANTFNSAQSITSDPAIISTGVITDGNSLPRWMESFSDAEDSMCHVQHQHLHRHHNSYHHLGYGMHASPEQQATWMQQHSRYPPPGFSTRQHNEATTEHRLSAL